ncbi:S41 family peptidase [Granulicella mallensis]|jgi:carboxyl-terminal processing protease|uniref:Carboxyl-terminal processing protease n=1 Tax=Granulicella mallensis TaxID=940614 RepID=A0A7W8E9D2_9BACT|nr:S41 family peptidase [Granulicella mallensis]MBB5064338.1 carboxyl-terminal processing protease [Granulicella mallensis]
MPKSVKISLLAVSVLLVLCIFLGVNTHGVRAAVDQSQEGAYRQINVYGEVLQHVQNDYVVDPNIPAVTEGALRGLLESLDADSSYLPPADYKAYKADKGGKAQVGLNVSKRFGYATIVSVVPGSPADKANLTDGDIIEAIGNQDTRDLSLAMIQLLLEGAPGSELQISVIRPRKVDPDKIKLNRAVVSEPAVAETMYENASILSLKPMVIDHEHVQQIEAKLKGMNKAGNKKILLDLRDVSAGDMAEATRLANFFLKSGTIATLEGQTFPKQTFTADAAKSINTTAPLVILVNRGTSGPAELVAGAIADNKRGDLVGEKTFGEGAQQKTFELPDGAALILSIAKYASPSGKKFEDEAVTPGTLVASNMDDLDSDSDDASSSDTTKTPAPVKHPSAPVDDQLTKALDMLKAKQA